MKVRTFAVLIAVVAMILSIGAARAATFESIDLDAAKQVMKDTIELASQENEDNREKIVSMIRRSLHLMRGPNADGVSYRYATAGMDDDIEPVQLLSRTVQAVWEYGQKETIKVQTSGVYAFQIYMPLHRGIFKNNGNMYLDSYTVEYTINGEKKTETREYKDWMTRETTLDVPLPGIAENASLELVAGVAPGDMDHVIVHVYAKYPEVDDDDRNPFSYSVEELRESFSRMEIGRRMKEIVELHQEAIRGIDYVLQDLVSTPAGGGESAAPAGPSNAELVAKLKQVKYLLEGNALEADKGREKLDELIEGLE